MHVSINVKSPNNINKWQMGFNSGFKGLTERHEALEVVGVSGVQNWFDNMWTGGFSLVKSLNCDVSLHGDSQ
jgi:hypothetical protein